MFLTLFYAVSTTLQCNTWKCESEILNKLSSYKNTFSKYFHLLELFCPICMFMGTDIPGPSQYTEYSPEQLQQR